MTWVVFSYSLPPQGLSSPRVALWRRLRRLGAYSPTGGIHILPAREECLEAFQWLAEEVKHTKGEALVMKVEQFKGLSDAELMDRFRKARAHDYAALDAQTAVLEAQLNPELKPEERSQLWEGLERVRRQYAVVARGPFPSSPVTAALALERPRVKGLLDHKGRRTCRDARQQYAHMPC